MNISFFSSLAALAAALLFNHKAITGILQYNFRILPYSSVFFLGFVPSSGPTTPASLSWSMTLAARLNPIFKHPLEHSDRCLVLIDDKTSCLHKVLIAVTRSIHRGRLRSAVMIDLILYF